MASGHAARFLTPRNAAPQIHSSCPVHRLRHHRRSRHHPRPGPAHLHRPLGAHRRPGRIIFHHPIHRIVHRSCSIQPAAHSRLSQRPGPRLSAPVRGSRRPHQLQSVHRLVFHRGLRLWFWLNHSGHESVHRRNRGIAPGRRPQSPQYGLRSRRHRLPNCNARGNQRRPPHRSPLRHRHLVHAAQRYFLGHEIRAFPRTNAARKPPISTKSLQSILSTFPSP